MSSRYFGNLKILSSLRLGVVSLLLVFSYSLEAKMFGKSCLKIFSEDRIFYSIDGKPTVNGIMVTGPREIPLENILNRFHIDGDFIARMRMKKVVSIGEGISDFVPYLRSQLVLAEGVDPLYGASVHNISVKAVRDYVNTHKAYLKFGTVEDLPYRSESVDFIFSNALFNNLAAVHPQVMMKGFDEIVRVLKPGGEAFIHAPPLVQQLVLQNSKNVQFHQVSIEGDFIHISKNTSDQLIPWRYGLLDTRAKDSQTWLDQSNYQDFQGLIGRTEDIWVAFRLSSSDFQRYREPVEIAPGISLLQ